MLGILIRAPPASPHAFRTASQVLLATLAIPIAPVPSETDRFLEVDDTGRDKARRLAGLLRMSSPPSRASLMKDMVGVGGVCKIY